MTYKHIFGIITGVLITTGVLIACKSEAEGDVIFSSEFIKLTDNTIELTKDPGSQTVAVEANCDWTLSADNSGWSDLVVQKASASSFKISTGENLLREERTANITITSKSGIKKVLTVRQAIGDLVIRTNLNSIAFSEDGGSNSFLIQSNTSWEVAISYTTGDEGWLHVDSNTGSGDQSISLTAEKPVNDNDRNAIVTVRSTETGVTASVSISVSQDGLSQIYLNVTPEQLLFECLPSDSKLIDVSQSNAQWWITSVSIVPKEDNSWFTLDKQSGVGTGQIKVTCTDNATAERRMATIIFTSGNKNGGETQQVMIEQEAGKTPDITGFAAISTENILKTISFNFGFSSQFPVTEYGICYSITNDTPTISDGHTSLESSEKSASNLSVTVNNLQPRSNYHARAYAKSAVGVAYSNNIISFTTLGESPDKGDNPPLF